MIMIKYKITQEYGNKVINKMYQLCFENNPKKQNS